MGKKIILYTKGKGWTHCQQAKEFLLRKGVVFCEKNILEDEAARKEFTETYHAQKTPVLVIEHVYLDASPESLKNIFT